MKYRKNARLNVRQIKDIRTSGGARRRNATYGTDATDDTNISPESAQAEENYRRYGQITYSKAYSPVGKIRPMHVATNRQGKFELRSEKPDSADRTKKPKLTAIQKDRANPKRLRVKRPKGRTT